jgi:oligopeptide transport system substrate-binding protein
MRMKNYKLIALLAAGGILVAAYGCRKKAESAGAEEMVLHHLMPTQVRGLDPGDIRDVYSATIATQICETLYEYHFLKRPYVIVPLLAAALPQVSEDKLTYTITIKKGVLFQDDACFPGGKGRELKAVDFVYSIKRMANIKYLSQNWSLFDDKIIGLDEFREYTKSCPSEESVDYNREAKGLRATDDYTLVIKLKRPWPQMVETALADHCTAPMAKEAVDYYKKDIVGHPVGTGPYRLKEWQRGSFIELVKNPTYRPEYYPTEGEPGDVEAGYLADAGKRIPFADRAIWKIILEDQPGWFLFLQGELDSSGIPKDNFNEAMTVSRTLTPEMQKRNIELKTFIDPSTFFVGFNMLDPVLGKNKPLRKAISRAIDRQKFIDLFSNGRDMIAHGVVSPLMDSYDPSISEKGFAKYDLDEARALVKEAQAIQGGDIPVLKLAVPGTDTVQRQMGQFIKRQFEDVGLQVEVQCMDWPTYQEKMNSASLQMLFSGNHASIPDAQDFLQMFYSKYWAPGANNFNYKNEEFDKLYEKAVVMDDGPERRALYRQMEIVALEDYPAAFLNHRVAYVLNHDWYKNFKPHAFSYGLTKYRRVDLEKRNAYKDLLKTIKD